MNRIIEHIIVGIITGVIIVFALSQPLPNDEECKTATSDYMVSLCDETKKEVRIIFINNLK